MRLTSKTRVRPMGQRLLVKPIPDSEYMGKAGIIVTPEKAETKSTVGVVLALGDGQQDSNFTGTWPPLKKGDIVVYDRFAGVELCMDDEPEKLWPRILGIDEILAVVEPETKGGAGR